MSAPLCTCGHRDIDHERVSGSTICFGRGGPCACRAYTLPRREEAR